MTAICADCDHVHGETRKLAPYRWRCLKRPMPLEPDAVLLFVDPRYMVNPPYSLCTNINKSGDCPDFTPRRIPQGENE